MSDGRFTELAVDLNLLAALGVRLVITSTLQLGKELLGTERNAYGDH